MYNVEENLTKYMKTIGTEVLFSPAPGSTIKKVRKSIEITQNDLANLIGIRRETVSRIETGAITPTYSFIRKFSKTASIIKVFRDINALKEANTEDGKFPFSPTFIRTHFSLSSEKFEDLMRLGDASYNKTKKKILRRI